ncbi:LacI family DNA-binding transcriptional regulator [Tropicimonas sediminicola]|uniref:Transcriptional regulator, LacI family n=1 Tax=Tropicimonas sediminicola TaxID=1031541 RepID=A0A239FH69_9RHOB|nr:LacI family DNA-binding transcriptional regulator [Tropicimonas sediminicola]SNS56266.1 transcriptional regulator, LacI family [Tropicimonas sediminicola]
MTKRAPSIRDVAIAAGVSTATVSRTLSSPEVVSEKTRETVYRAISETGYRLNVMARNLRRRETGAIAVLLPNLGNPFFAKILSGIAEVMSAAGYNVLITDTTPTSPDDHRFPEYFSHNQTDGLIVLDGMLNRELLLNRGTPEVRAPMVFACEWIDEIERPKVTIDNRAASERAVSHLIELGHRRVGHVCGPPDNVLTVTRRQGTREALQAAGLPCRDDWFYAGDFSLQSGADAARRWCETPDRPTAVHCASDEMAMGFIGELHRRRVRVPEDVSVVGFDDLEITAHFIPPLTTIHQPRVEIGRAAARMLLERMRIPPQDRQRGPVPRLVLPVELVERLSTAPPPVDARQNAG